MFFILSKILDFVISPYIWVFALLIAGIIVKRQPLKKRLLIGCAVAFYFFSNGFLTNIFITGWEIPAISDTAIHGKYDVAIVLGGYLNNDLTLHRIQFEHGADRLFQAVRLYKQGKVKKILLDGGSGDLYGSVVEAPLLHKYLLDIGIPDSVILTEPRSRNTHENALFAKHLLDSAAPGGRYLLITSGFHMRRALGCFNKTGIHTLPYVTERMDGPLKFELRYAILPDVMSLQIWELLMHEWIGYITYKIAGYI